MKYIAHSHRTIHLLLFLLVLTLSACTETIEIDVSDTEPQLVVDGQITDKEGASWVKLSLSTSYNDTIEAPTVSEAIITLYDDNGREEIIAESPIGSGVFPILTAGEISRNYWIEIAYQGQVYRSIPEQLIAVPPINAIYHELIDIEDDNTLVYSIKLDATETPNEHNFYQWRVYINGVYQNKLYDLAIAKDDFLDGNDIVAFEVFYDAMNRGDHILVEQLSLTQRTYEFLYLLDDQTANRGGLFDTPPAPIPGNLINTQDSHERLLGYFRASAITDIETVITQ